MNSRQPSYVRYACHLMKAWTWVAAAAALVGVGSVAGFGVVAHEELSALEHGPAYTLPAPVEVLEPAQGSPIESSSLHDALLSAATNPALAEFHARVTDASTGEVVFDQQSGVALRPASTTKILTAAAAILQLGSDDVVTTQVYRGPNPGEVVIKAAGDVWMDAEAIDALATQLNGLGEPVTSVAIDSSYWGQMPEMLPGWDPVDIDGGYVAPLQPAMLNGGRGLVEETGDVPRSHAPALDVAQALAGAIGAEAAGAAPVPEGAQVVASVDSPDLVTRLDMMMKHSDNVYAEAIGREVALDRAATDAPGATMAALSEHGFDTAGTEIHDNSGLSTMNLITPKLLDSILADAAAKPELRPLLNALPVASGEGTLIERYGDLPGRGWVRAKTGTLDDTSGLAGTVTSVNGNVYTFAFLSNGSSVLEARRAMDEMASILRAY